ncbi:hypothetical protein BDAP_002856 [Binucleata daphniae]
MVMIGITVACVSKKEGNGILVTLDYTKWKDDKYIDQLEKLATCLQELPSEIYDKKEELIMFWNKYAKQQLTKKMTPVDKQTYTEYNYFDCLNKIAEHEVNKFLCNKKNNNPLLYDSIEKYNEITAKECITTKNLLYLTNFLLEIPTIGFSSVMLDVEEEVEMVEEVVEMVEEEVEIVEEEVEINEEEVEIGEEADEIYE